MCKFNQIVTHSHISFHQHWGPVTKWLMRMFQTSLTSPRFHWVSLWRIPETAALLGNQPLLRLLTLQCVRHGADALHHVLFVLGADLASCNQFITFFHFFYCCL